MLLGAVGLLLVLACANVANLLLARTSAREHELALRAALGAGRWRLVRQLLCESLLLSAAGGALGIACAAWGIDALVALSGRYLPRAAEVRMDGRVLSVGIVLAFATGLASGLLPALRGTKAAPMTALRESGSSATARSGRLRDALVALEVAMALVLVLCAGLMANSFLRLTRVDPGFDADHTLVARFDIPDDRYPDDRIVAVYDRLIDRVRQVPGVIAAGAIKDVPLRGQGESYSYTVPGEPAPPPGAEPHADTAPVSPGYFRALGIELLAGRDIEPTDTDRSPAVAVVNQALARAAFSGRDPIGRTILVGRVPVRVVGLVRDVYNERLDVPPRPAIFLPETQMTRVVVSLVVRTQGQPMLLLPAVRDAIRSVDGDLALTELAPLRTIVAESLSAPRFLSVLLGIFGAIALVLATVGLYGVVATAVSQRRREMGIRMALGADRASVIARTLRRGMVPVALGLATGALAALGALRLLSGLLYGVGPFDPATVLATIALLLSAALVAAWVPARRAALVDPMTVLRAD